jgi:8-oxo-dGTP pyrophosphatase MutT (NUDIX family)
MAFSGEALQRLESLLAGARPEEIVDQTLRRAAVLVPLVPSEEGVSILFQKRSEELPVHRGQIGFPGGSVERGEPLEEAAVRETEEETGIDRRSIRLLGRLDDVVTNTGYLVAPFVGVVPSSVHYVLQQSEVSEVFEVPVSLLLDPSRPIVRYVTYKGVRVPTYVYDVEGREIWGLTGRMLKMFLDYARLAV